jgi:hypothetical protein
LISVLIITIPIIGRGIFFAYNNKTHGLGTILLVSASHVADLLLENITQEREEKIQ